MKFQLAKYCSHPFHQDFQVVSTVFVKKFCGIIAIHTPNDKKKVHHMFK